jgi:DNA (cytosine-5)-methyltransferase 1
MNLPKVGMKAYTLQGGGATSQNSQGMGWNEDISFTLNNTDVHGVAIAFEPGIAQREGGDNRFVEDLSPTIRSNMGDNQVAAAYHLSVRRLTPIECERLQGFPDNHTMIPWRKKPAEDCPDGPRYKAMGNSMAVPVMNWIGKRIQMVQS